MPQVDFNTFLSIIFMFILCILILFNILGYFNPVLTTLQKKIETNFEQVNFVNNTKKIKKDLKKDQEKDFLTKIL